MVPGKLDTYIHKNEVGSHLYTIGLNVRAKAIKLLEENIDVKLYDFALDNDVLDTTLKGQIKKE